MLSYVQTNCDLKDCFVHLRFELNSANYKTKHRLRRARRNALSWDSVTVSRAGETTSKPYMYTSTEHDNIKLAFRLRDAK